MTDDILGLLDASEPPKRPGLTPDNLLTALKKGPATTEELATAFGQHTDAIEAILGVLIDTGSNLHIRGDGAWVLSKILVPRRGSEFVYTSRLDNTFVFGVASDAHLGSKYERLDVLNDLYDWFHREGVDRVFNAGNWIEGDDPKTAHDAHVHGLEPQLDYLAAHFPQRPGLVTYAVAGEDHEGWYSRREAIDIGRFAERRMRDKGRTDWVDLGFMEAAITLRNANTGVDGYPMLVMHPGGGTAYALSYRPQKLVESLQGGEKPSVILIGHYHKMSVNLIRSVWAIQAGCTQDQTPFMRKIPTEPHIGGFIVTLHQDPETGAIVGCDVKMRQFFNKAYENGRWSKSGPVVQPEKVVMGRG